MEKLMDKLELEGGLANPNTGDTPSLTKRSYAFKVELPAMISKGNCRWMARRERGACRRFDVSHFFFPNAFAAVLRCGSYFTSCFSDLFT
jgi:hypothetical protein